MSQYYKPDRNPGWNYGGPKWRLSRSKIGLFTECPRCFYIDRRLGVGQPPGFPFALNSAVDTLLKKEFDVHRDGQTAHPLMKAYGLDMVPFAHEKMNEWRENFKGVQYHHEPTNFIMTGAVDDLWVNKEGEIVVVDYKSTSKPAKVTLDAEWQTSYKRQMEMYQWLLRKLGFKVSNTGYFVYANGKTDRQAFDGKLDFDIDLLPYTGDDSWVGGTLLEIKQCLDSDDMPDSKVGCDYCAYYEARKMLN